MGKTVTRYETQRAVVLGVSTYNLTDEEFAEYEGLDENDRASWFDENFVPDSYHSDVDEILDTEDIEFVTWGRGA